MDDYKAELDRRRERGRLAQSAFRKRQAQLKQSIQDENSLLKDAIRAIADEAQMADRPALRKKIQEAAALVGVEIRGQTNPALSRTSTSTGSASNPEWQLTESINHSDADDIASFSDVRNILHQSLAGLEQQPHSQTLEHWEQQRAKHTRIRPDPFQCHRCTDGPATVLPFLGSGAFSFAGRIFWHLVERFETERGNDHLSEPIRMSPAMNSPPLRFQDLLEKSNSSHSIEPKNWIKMVEARIAYRRQERPLSPSDAIDLSSGTPVVQDPTARDQISSRWLSPILAEQRMRVIVGDDVFSVLATPLLQRWESNGRRKNVFDHRNSDLIEGFLDTLSDSYVCFGDGPRWDIESFDVVLKDWCLSIIGSFL